jgi:hypothetical protein
MQNPSVWRLARLEKRLDLVSATQLQRRRRHAPSCMGATDGQSNWPICEKPWENRGFTAERTGIELLGVFPVFCDSSKGARRMF